jgi:hypothetical protein
LSLGLSDSFQVEPLASELEEKVTSLYIHDVLCLERATWKNLGELGYISARLEEEIDEREETKSSMTSSQRQGMLRKPEMKERSQFYITRSRNLQ